MHELLTTGDHTLFIGKIVEAYVNKGLFTDKYEIEKTSMLYHAGSKNFVTLDPKSYKQ